VGKKRKEKLKSVADIKPDTHNGAVANVEPWIVLFTIFLRDFDHGWRPPIEPKYTVGKFNCSPAFHESQLCCTSMFLQVLPFSAGSTKILCLFANEEELTASRALTRGHVFLGQLLRKLFLDLLLLFASERSDGHEFFTFF
jgi:hypothetical protein